MRSLAERLLLSLAAIVAEMDELLDISTIDHVPDRAQRMADTSGVMVLSLSDSLWGPSDDRQRNLQRALLERWTPWLEQMQLLFSEDTGPRRKELTKASNAVAAWIERTGRGLALPPTIAQAKNAFRKAVQPLELALRSLTSESKQVLVVPDTNVLIRSPDVVKYSAVLETDAFTIVLVPGVLGELDGHKVNHRNPDVRDKAMKMSNRIKGWRNQGDLAVGVRVQADIWVRVEGREPDFSKTLSWLQRETVDDRIIASALEIQRKNPGACVVVLTGDTLMLSKCDAAGVPTVDTPEPDA